MPSDFDDDLDFQPTPRGKPASGPATPALSQASTSLGKAIWPGGVVETLAGGSGARRRLPNVVKYSAPPLSRFWHPSAPPHYEMVWPGDAASAETLDGFARRLVAAARSDQKPAHDHPELNRLNALVDSLLDQAATLHRQNWRVGLVSPENLLVGPLPDRPEVVWIDLGVAVKGDDIGLPAWTTDANPNRWLWDHDPADQSIAAPNSPGRLSTELSDVRALARLLASLAGYDRPKSAADVPNRPGPLAVLREALEGKIATAEQLRIRLQSSPLSHAIVEPPPEVVHPPIYGPGDSIELEPIPKRGKGPFIALGLLAVSLVGAAVALGVFKGKPSPTEVVENAKPTEPGKEPTTSTGRLVTPKDLGKKGEEPSPQDVVKGIEAISKDHLGIFAPGERDRRRDAVLNDWIKVYKASEARASDQANRFVVARELGEMIRTLEALRLQSPPPPELADKERQCIDFAKLRILELSGSSESP